MSTRETPLWQGAREILYLVGLKTQDSQIVGNGNGNPRLQREEVKDMLNPFCFMPVFGFSKPHSERSYSYTIYWVLRLMLVQSHWHPITKAYLNICEGSSLPMSIIYTYMYTHSQLMTLLFEILRSGVWKIKGKATLYSEHMYQPLPSTLNILSLKFLEAKSSYS